jgi:hypothetical protein
MNSVMPAIAAKVALLLVVALASATNVDAQTHRRRGPRDVERPPPAAPLDKRDSVVAAPGVFAGRPYWLALAECGGIYFKLNTLYTDLAVHARVVKPDPKANAEFTRKLNEAITTATTFFDGAEQTLMIDRGIERAEAVLTYDAQSRAAGDRFKTVDTALAAVKACPVLYRACRETHPKACSETLTPTG